MNRKNLWKNGYKQIRVKQTLNLTIIKIKIGGKEYENYNSNVE